MSLENPYEKFLLHNPHPRQLKKYSVSGNDSAMHIFHGNQKLINFSSNDYLGLAKHPRLIQGSHEYAKKWGIGAASSRLVTGNFTLYEELETKLAASIGKPAALILGSGYQTNLSVLEALLDAEVLGEQALVFCDRYVHVSMLAATMHVARLFRFQHNDLTHLQNLLEKYADSKRPKFILVESVYSMDGDQADLEKIIQLAAVHQAILYVDDAHAVGVYGKNGWGKASLHAAGCDVVMGTFSKALGSYGAYLACSATLRDYLINKCRGLIYTTGLSPAVLGAISAAIDLLPELDQARMDLQTKTQQVKAHFQALGLDCGNSTTHIIPWLINDADLAMQVSAALEKHGILATTIRPPTVPLGTSRVRFCLSAAHTAEDIAALLRAITAVASDFPLVIKPVTV